MASSDEEDVCVGPLSLNEIRRALEIEDPFRKSPSRNDDIFTCVLMNESFEDMDDNYMIGNDRSEDPLCGLGLENEVNGDVDLNSSEYTLIAQNNSVTNMLSMDPLKLYEASTPVGLKKLEDAFSSASYEDLCGERSTDPLNYKLHSAINVLQVDPLQLHEISTPVCSKNIEDASSSTSYERERSTDPLSYMPQQKLDFGFTKNQNDVTDRWEGLVKNLSKNDRILDQTEPEDLYKTIYESTKISKIKPKDGLDLTILEQPDWQNESLNSFETMERLTSSPSASSKTYDIKSDITSAYETAQQSGLGTSSDSNDFFFSARNTSGDSGSVDKYHENSNEKDSNCIRSKQELCEHQETQDTDTSHEFDNTFEQMQYLMNLNDKEAETIPDKAIKIGVNILKTPECTNLKHPYPKFSPITPTSDTDLSEGASYAVKSNRKNYFPKPSPLQNRNFNSVFRKPKNPNLLELKKVLPRSPHKYAHIASPIGMYIKNSPRVPLIGTYTAGKHTSGKKEFEAAFHDEEQENTQKENICTEYPTTLPAKAYKSSEFTSMTYVKPPSLKGLSKNDKIRKLISAGPSYEVIKHEGRIKHSKLPRPKAKPEDSFADLSISSAEISVCVRKEAVRTETISHKKP